jgi:transglutaminase-like putative cysteine protease
MLQAQLEYRVTAPAVVVVQVAAAAASGGGGGGAKEILTATVDGTPVALQEITGSAVDGGRLHRVEAPPGALLIAYSATVEPAGPPAPVSALGRITALRPSRYCPSDTMAGFAGRLFGGYTDPTDRVRAIVDFVAGHLQYTSGVSDATTDATQTLLAGAGVCRDYAHLVATLSRAVEIPARVAAVYAPGLSPMDFHLVAETELDGLWRVWDATRLAPRPSLARIATGRDAADVAFGSVLSGAAELTDLQITATTDGDLPVDDHRSLVSLG